MRERERERERVRARRASARGREGDRVTEIRDRESVSERERGGRETYACISRTARISLIIQLPRQRAGKSIPTPFKFI
jgi:hypothetical protein